MGQMFSRVRNILLVVTTCSLAGCGGGSASNTPLAPTITWATPAAITYGTALGAAQLNASTTVAGTFSYSPAAGTVPGAGTDTLTATFTPTDTTHYTTATATVQLTVAKATPVITWTTPAAVLSGATLGDAQLNAKSATGGTFSYQPAAGTTLSTTGAQTLTATFLPTDSANYNTATATVSLMVLPATGAAVVDFGVPQQTIRGFGASTAWMPALPTAEINALFGTANNEVGLSILRVRIDPGGQSRWGAELLNAQQAQTAGATVFATPWTPPASMKSNNSTVMGSLPAANYASYAAYLASFVSYMKAGGVALDSISIQNEPDANVSYESCVWTAAELDAFAAGYGNQVGTKLMMPESESFVQSMSDTALNDPAAAANISIVAGHLYGVSPSYYTKAENQGKDVWMTEHYLSPQGNAATITDALAAAEEIHQSLTVGNYNAYLWWWAANWNPGTGVMNYGLVDTNNVPTYYGNAMAQFSRFIRPGYVRATATTTPVSGVYLSAYSGGGHTVLVLINSNTSAAQVPVTVKNATINSLTPYQTTATTQVAPLAALSVTSNVFTANLPAQSITTYVQ